MLFIQKDFWLKPILNRGQHNVSISNIETGVYANSTTNFALIIFENKHGYFPLKITISDTEPNIKYLNNLIETASGFEKIESSSQFLKIVDRLLNNELEIFIGEYSSTEFGSGLKINRFFKKKN